MADWLDKLPVMKEGLDATMAAGSGRSGGEEDALRHALWSAELARNYGSPAAFGATSVLEAAEQLVNLLPNKLLDKPRSWEDRKRVAAESWMDLKNNARGIWQGMLSDAEDDLNNKTTTQEALVKALRGQPLTTLPEYKWK